jgi:BASS family bile acid:Na+ symporter
MKAIESISMTVGKYMAVIILAVAAVSLFLPPAALWVQTAWINPLLMVVIFGMGLTLKRK